MAGCGEGYRARTGELKEVIEEVWKRQRNLGLDAVRFAWVKAHVGTHGDEKADQMAKSAAEFGDEEEGVEKVITEGGLRQEWKRRRAEERKVKGTGMGRVIHWNRKARVNYVHCCTGKGNLQAWRHILDEDSSDRCRKCGRYAETGKHIAVVCIHGEDVGRRWGTWEAMDEPERWRKGVKDPGLGPRPFGGKAYTYIALSEGIILQESVLYKRKPLKLVWLAQALKCPLGNRSASDTSTGCSRAQTLNLRCRQDN